MSINFLYYQLTPDIFFKFTTFDQLSCTNKKDKWAIRLLQHGINLVYANVAVFRSFFYCQSHFKVYRYSYLCFLSIHIGFFPLSDFIKGALIRRLLAQSHGSCTPAAVCRSPTHCLRCSERSDYGYKGVSLCILRVVTYKLLHLFFGAVLLALSCREVMAHPPYSSAQKERI